jgi:hypothetical protein
MKESVKLWFDEMEERTKIIALGGNITKATELKKMWSNKKMAEMFCWIKTIHGITFNKGFTSAETPDDWPALMTKDINLWPPKIHHMRKTEETSPSISFITCYDGAESILVERSKESGTSLFNPDWFGSIIMPVGTIPWWGLQFLQTPRGPLGTFDQPRRAPIPPHQKQVYLTLLLGVKVHQWGVLASYDWTASHHWVMDKRRIKHS